MESVILEKTDELPIEESEVKIEIHKESVADAYDGSYCAYDRLW